MGTIFQNLNKLKLLDMSNLKIPINTNMNNIFSNCKSLISLYLSNFKYIFNGMFKGLNTLTNLKIK